MTAGQVATLAWRIARPFARSIGTGVTIALYFMLRAPVVAMSEHGGLLSPGGSVSLPFVALGATLLIQRVVILFILLPLLAYRAVVDWTKGGWSLESKGRAPSP